MTDHIAWVYIYNSIGSNPRQSRYGLTTGFNRHRMRCLTSPLAGRAIHDSLQVIRGPSFLVEGGEEQPVARGEIWTGGGTHGSSGNSYEQPNSRYALAPRYRAILMPLETVLYLPKLLS